jgi:uncharacterized caspase-like protein
LKNKKFILILYVIVSSGLFPQNLGDSNKGSTSGQRKKGLRLAEAVEDIKELDKKAGIGKRYAIIVGVNKYADTGISPLSKARNDAKAIEKIFQSYGSFDGIALMTDDVDPSNTEKLFPTKQNIEDKVKSFLSGSSPNDMFVFFFSGHGISNKAGEDFLVTQNTNLIDKEDTALSVSWLVKQFKAKNISKVLLMLDACRETVYSTKSVSRNDLIPKDFNEGNISATFYSTSKGHFSYEDDDSDYGVFTKYLIYGMEGKADTDEDGVVSFTDLKKYVERGVMDWSRKKGKVNELSQVPYTKIYNEETNGDLAITFAKNPRESLADDNEFSRTWDEALKRSAIFPGWGQWFKKDTYKATGFGLLGVGLLGGIGASYSQYQSAKAGYMSAGQNELLFSFSTTDFGALNLIALSQANEAKARVETASGTISTLSIAFAGVYLINVIDSVIMPKPKKGAFLYEKQNGFQFSIRREFLPVNTGDMSLQSGNFGQLEYVWNF